MSSASSTFPPLKERPIKDTVVLFDVDETLTPARRFVSPEILAMLQVLRSRVAIGFVGGSNLPKQQEQLATGNTDGRQSTMKPRVHDSQL